MSNLYLDHTGWTKKIGCLLYTFCYYGQKYFNANFENFKKSKKLWQGPRAPERGSQNFFDFNFFSTLH